MLNSATRWRSGLARFDWMLRPTAAALPVKTGFPVCSCLNDWCVPELAVLYSELHIVLRVVCSR